MENGLLIDKSAKTEHFIQSPADAVPCRYGQSETAFPSDSPTLLMPQSPPMKICEQCDETSGGRPEHVQALAVASPRAECPVPFGEYELLEEIGRGAMGVVYKARQLRLKRIVALKTLLPAMLRQEGAYEQLLAEAEVAAQLDHPGIVPIHDVGRHDGQPYICMTFIDGESLEASLKRHPLVIEQTVRIVADVAVAVQYAHDHGVIHRDLKPANILLDRSGRARVGDFGLARKLGAAEKNSNVIAGTPSYMSPEQASGQNERIGPASDIYSLGTILFHCLTGRTPFDGKSSSSILHQVVEAEPPLPRSINPTIPEEFEAIILRCLRKDPAARYTSAAELAARLRQMEGSAPIGG
jgi:eukaryotic-like serine/threonine-protein kinase